MYLVFRTVHQGPPPVGEGSRRSRSAPTWNRAEEGRALLTGRALGPKVPKVRTRMAMTSARLWKSAKHEMDTTEGDIGQSTRGPGVTWLLRVTTAFSFMMAS